MTTDAAIFCPHRIDDWIESPDCWLCPGCRCAVCSRCTRLFTAFLPAEEFEDLWWEHSCDCRHTFSRHVLVPPRCWLRDHPAVEGDEKAVAAVVPAERTHAEPLDGRQAMMSLISSMERTNASTTPGRVQVSAENLHAVLDEAQKVTLYFHAIGDDHWHSKLKDIAERRVPLTGTLEEALRRIRHLRGPLVFSNPDGSALRLDQLHERLWGASRRAGLRKIRWHDLRHSFASQLASAAVPLHRVQEWLGHSTIGMTMRYAHLAPGGGADLIRALESPAVATAWQREGG
jgi:hypothetical protein